MEKGYAVRTRPSGVIEKLEMEGGYQEIQRLVDGSFEVVYFMDPNLDIVMLVDEEGKLKGKSFNLLASALYFRDYIVGDAVFMKLERVGEYQDLDIVPFTEEEADAFLDWLKSIRPIVVL